MTRAKPSKKLNPAYVKAIQQKVNGCPYFGLLSMELVSLGWGRCRIKVAVQEKHLQPYGNAHGGVCASLVDAAAFWAVFSKMAPQLGLITVELKLNYLIPASEGILVAEGRSIKEGKTICLGEAAVSNNAGQLVAHGTSTMMVLKSLKIRGQSDLPQKFLG